jgi:tRNA A-37 threonylcarbamoyl transferase component Bud32
MTTFKGFTIDSSGVDGRTLSPKRLDTMDRLLTDTFGPEYHLTGIERLKSKKNVVLRLGLDSYEERNTQLVAKLFVTGNYDLEVDILQKCYQENLTVPEVIDVDQGVILMSFIPGPTFTEKINQTFEPRLMKQLALWYHKYHTVTGMIKGDPRLRNFICENGILYGLDFEEARSDHWIADIAGASASLIDTRPIFDERKRRLSWNLLEEYLQLRGEERTKAIDDLFITTLVDTLKQTSYWREDQHIMDLAEKIRTEGF